MKPNNKIKLKNTTLSPVLPKGRDGGVGWNKDPVVSPRLSQGWVFFCTWSHQAQEKRRSPWSHPEERGWNEQGCVKQIKQEIKRRIFTYCFSWAVSKPGKAELLDWVGMGRRFPSPGQRHQHNEKHHDYRIHTEYFPSGSQYSTVLSDHPSACWKGCWTEASINKSLAGAGIFSLLFDSGHQVGDDRHWGV